MDQFIKSLTSNQVVASFFIIIVLFVIRFFSDTWLNHRDKMENEVRKRIRSNIRNGLFFLAVVAMIFIWAPALRTFALSLTAFAVAMIVATKELILCFSGYLVKSSRGLARVGDWIEINGVRGEIVDQDFLTTVLEELGTGSSKFDFTGRSVVVPNSQFLSATVRNERFNKRYTYHTFRVTTKPDVDTSVFRARLLEALNEAVAPYQEVALRYIGIIEKRASIKLSDSMTQMHFSFRDEGSQSIDFTCFVPVQEAVAIENKIKIMAADEISAFYARQKAEDKN